MTELSDTHRQVLSALSDTVVPAVEHEPDPSGFYARKASDIGVPQAIEQALAGMAPEQQQGLAQLLDALAEQGFLRASRRSRQQLMSNVALIRPRRRRRGGGVDAAEPVLRAMRTSA